MGEVITPAIKIGQLFRDTCAPFDFIRITGFAEGYDGKKRFVDAQAFDTAVGAELMKEVSL
jgi:hypothetical protein